jgi:hypothetical protein
MGTFLLGALRKDHGTFQAHKQANMPVEVFTQVGAPQANQGRKNGCETYSRLIGDSHDNCIGCFRWGDT